MPTSSRNTRNSKSLSSFARCEARTEQKCTVSKKLARRMPTTIIFVKKKLNKKKERTQGSMGKKY
jgi:hypothetical protein